MLAYINFRKQNISSLVAKAPFKNFAKFTVFKCCFIYIYRKVSLIVCLSVCVCVLSSVFTCNKDNTICPGRDAGEGAPNT